MESKPNRKKNTKPHKEKKNPEGRAKWLEYKRNRPKKHNPPLERKGK